MPPVGKGTVTDSTQKPKGYLWDRLAAATTREEVVAIRDHAAAHRYSSEGQLMRAIADRLAAFDAPPAPAEEG